MARNESCFASFSHCYVTCCPWTHWGRVTHICVSKLTIIGSDNGLSPGRRQAIIWTNAGILSIGPLGTNFSEILIEILTFSFKKMHLKMSSGKWRPFVSASIVNDGNCRHSMPVGKEGYAYDALPHTFNIGVFKCSKQFYHSKTYLQLICEPSCQLRCCFWHHWLGGISRKPCQWLAWGVCWHTLAFVTHESTCSLIELTAMEKIMSFPAETQTIMLWYATTPYIKQWLLLLIHVLIVFDRFYFCYTWCTISKFHSWISVGRSNEQNQCTKIEIEGKSLILVNR